MKKQNKTDKTSLETAYFAMGCFWGPQLLFSKTSGVISTKSGYIGGNQKLFPNSTYEQVCTNLTGYAETIEIKFDPKKIKYTDLLNLFFSNHNPTTKNRQHFDIGTQYRSAIFYLNEKQKKEIQKSLKKHQKNYNEKIVTEIQNSKKFKFFPAEDYHQDYLKKHGINVPTCHA